MTGKIEILESCINLNLTADTKEDVIRELAGMLVEQGFVNAEYIDNVIEREQSYPTGLVFHNIIIAIPHGSAEYVNESAIAIGRCVNKPEFANMEDFAEKIHVDIVVLLAVKNPDNHLMILNNLIELFKSEENNKVLMECSSEEKVRQLFEKCLYAID